MVQRNMSTKVTTDAQTQWEFKAFLLHNDKLIFMNFQQRLTCSNKNYFLITFLLNIVIYVIYGLHLEKQ